MWSYSASCLTILSISNIVVSILVYHVRNLGINVCCLGFHWTEFGLSRSPIWIALQYLDLSSLLGWRHTQNMHTPPPPSLLLCSLKLELSAPLIHFLPLLIPSILALSLSHFGLPTPPPSLSGRHGRWMTYYCNTLAVGLGRAMAAFSWLKLV